LIINKNTLNAGDIEPKTKQFSFPAYTHRLRVSWRVGFIR